MSKLLTLCVFFINFSCLLRAEIENLDLLLPCLEGAKIGRIEQAKAAIKGELYQITYRGLLDRINQMFERMPEILRQPQRSSPFQMIRKHLQKSDEQPFIMTSSLEEDFLRFKIKVIENYNVIIACLGGDIPYPLAKLMGAFNALLHMLPKYAGMLLDFSEKKELEKYHEQLKEDSRVLLILANDLIELSVVLNDIVLNPSDNKCSTEILMNAAGYKYVPEHVSRPPSSTAMSAVSVDPFLPSA